MKIIRLTWAVIEAHYTSGTIPNFRALEWLGAGLPFFDELCCVCIERGFIVLRKTG